MSTTAIGGVTLVNWALGSLAARLPLAVGLALGLSAVTVATAVLLPSAMTKWLSPRGLRWIGSFEPLRRMAVLALLIWLVGSLMRPPLGDVLDAGLAAAMLLGTRAAGRWMAAAALWVVCVGLAFVIIGAYGLHGLGLTPPRALPGVAALAFVAAAWFAIPVLSLGMPLTGPSSVLNRAIYGAVSFTGLTAGLLTARVSAAVDAGPVSQLAHVVGGLTPVVVAGLVASSLVAQALLARNNAPSTRERRPVWDYGAAALATAVVMALAAAGLRAAMPTWGTGGLWAAVTAVLLSVVLWFAGRRIRPAGDGGPG
jgi:hypothetical protein